MSLCVSNFFTCVDVVVSFNFCCELQLMCCNNCQLEFLNIIYNCIPWFEKGEIVQRKKKPELKIRE